MKILKEVLRQNKNAIAVFLVMTAGNTAVFALYDIFIEPFLYAVFLTALFLVVLLGVSFFREKEKSRERERMKNSILTEWRSLQSADTLTEEDYHEMIKTLGAQLETLVSAADEERQDMLDYYTAWVHQIKTPIAVMKLKLSDDTPEHHALLMELMRIEQYVDMVLQYIRIGSEVNDLVIREYPLDGLIREAVRKQTMQFVGKKLQLVYEATDAVVVTDQKWFACILDQLLSNAVKYTNAGSVTISYSDGKLTVSDTGIGISPEDLPRIFEKGYTGSNGRIGQKSSGLGLYLAKKAADLLSIDITAESVPSSGTSFTLTLNPPCSIAG